MRKQNLMNMLIIVSILLLGTGVFGDITPLINYQGKLASNDVLVNETLPMEFSIWDSASGGNRLWTSGTVSIAVRDGIFSYILGNANQSGFASINWNQDLYIEVVVDGETPTPREQFKGVPYSMLSRDLALTNGKTIKNSWVTNGDQIKGTAILGTTLPGAHAHSHSPGQSDALEANSIVSSNIVNSQVSNADLADNSVNSAKIQDNTIVAGDIRANSIASSNIINLTITAADLQDASVTGPKIVSSSISNRHLAATSRSLYEYHYDNCGAGEYFVEIWDGTGLGLCFEINERGSTIWMQAARTCANLGKRLPDYHEWRIACDGNYGGGAGTPNSNLNNMTGNWEWASSRPSSDDDGTDDGAMSIIAGGSDCASVGRGWVRRDDGDERSHPFRCVR